MRSLSSYFQSLTFTELSEEATLSIDVSIDVDDQPGCLCHQELLDFAGTDELQW